MNSQKLSKTHALNSTGWGVILAVERMTLVEEVAQEGADARPRVKQDRLSTLTRGSLWLRQTELVDKLLASNYVSHAPGEPELKRGPEDIGMIVASMGI